MELISRDRVVEVVILLAVIHFRVRFGSYLKINAALDAKWVAKTGSVMRHVFIFDSDGTALKG